MAHSSNTDNPHTAAIASFVSGFRYERIPADVLTRIKLLVLDSLGCAIYGADLAWSRILRESLAELDETKSACVWGTPDRLSPPHAVLVNGSLVQSFEFDDVHRVGVLHVGAVTLPPIFAVIERDPSISGRDFLAATVAGYEIGPRVGICMGQEHIGQGGGFSCRDRRRLRNRGPGWDLQGSGGHWKGLGIGRDAWGILGCLW